MKKHPVASTGNSEEMEVVREHNRVLDQTLDWVNGIRQAFLGLPPLSELPRGMSLAHDSCPISVALDGKFTVGNYFISATGGPRISEMPEYVCSFVWRFDAGLYPHLLCK